MRLIKIWDDGRWYDKWDKINKIWDGGWDKINKYEMMVSDEIMVDKIISTI